MLSNLHVLRSSTLLNSLTTEQIESLATSSKLVTVDKGHVIWTSGAVVDFFGLVGSGFIKMCRSTADGQETTVEIVGPGQIYGLLGTIDGSGCPLSSIAVTKTVYLRIPKRAFMPIYEANNALKDRLVRRTTLRLRSAHDLMARLISGRVDQRIAAVLMILSESYGEEVEGGIRINVPLTRQDVADMTGTTVESAIRTMSRWQKDGLIQTDHHYVVLTRVREIEALLAA
ncbi:MAG: CRP-like cAMP-activated global transcriptional regulator [Fimbriimonadales bacterium]|nr:MAG: Crp/Fnr family transcriptional regulator [Armatimonadota bacterium]MBV6504326.1 CRP-like cAMP-activated global transcriptional regulator [Fimbriimonadales bacterium]MCE7900491.1 Crp/Fnr family transcriptional regulator [Armatimonadetes bacterium ATM1]MDL1928379.1 Crp/Fnr family transcriptional regulator [Fimbriimonadia bacterium ATM]MBC6969066.1 Crp/Fnr family transcriptional regulator [Armatimonadota bacterium]